ncbi:uncharacterized protein LOC133865527 [Alnus glutinosa]|uniref:uncharacterized protein LOC133865527 n=1 Tax=Alnus glutinosa TaxID=3517 RepID=UPI002D7706A2|nr:uncharacterized protein LOC133865527 [Alnus glutinosa]
MEPMDIVGKSKEDASLPKATMTKIIKEMLPPDVRDARDAQDLLIECCVDYIEKFKKYEADYTCRLMAKYFSKKNLYGGDIFDENMTIDDEIIKSSRWPCTRSYADPLQGFEDKSNGVSAYSDESPPNVSNPVKKNG